MGMRSLRIPGKTAHQVAEVVFDPMHVQHGQKELWGLVPKGHGGRARGDLHVFDDELRHVGDEALLVTSAMCARIERFQISRSRNGGSSCVQRTSRSADVPLTFEKYTDRGVYSVWGTIQSPPQIPVIADGLFRHYPAEGERASFRPEPPMSPWETGIQLPNINCEKCTLQVIQFMADHGYNQPGGYSYHHCADLRITVDPSKAGRRRRLETN